MAKKKKTTAKREEVKNQTAMRLKTWEAMKDLTTPRWNYREYHAALTHSGRNVPSNIMCAPGHDSTGAYGRYDPKIFKSMLALDLRTLATWRGNSKAAKWSHYDKRRERSAKDNTDDDGFKDSVTFKIPRRQYAADEDVDVS
ncbi:MAG: hypothetical protein Q9181_006901 [Wetmoreana brouardii]